MKRQLIRFSFLLATSLLFVACKNGDATNEASPTGADSTSVTEVAKTETAQVESHIVFPEGSLKIVWVNMDSLLHNYDYYFDQQREMQQKTSRAEADVQKRGNALQNRFITLQDKAEKGLMTRSEMQKEQERLQLEQQEFMKLQESYRQDLMEEEQVRTRKVMAAITDYVVKYNEKHGYDYVLTGPLLFGNEAMNITSDILQGLNAEYAATHKKDTSAAK